MNIDLYKNIPSGKIITLVLRHAERYPIEKMERAFDALLTENGKKTAVKLGETISAHNPFTFYHSPVERCRQTAESMINGITVKNGKAELGGMDLILGAPYLKGDWKIIAEMATNQGQERFIRSWFNGEVSEEILYPLKESAKKQLSGLIKQLINSETNCVNITHDWNIVLLKEYFFGIQHEQDGMPGYLDGMLAYVENENVNLFYKNKKTIVSIKDLS
jgi:hypothetical protein